MKRFIVAITLALVAALAFALPKPAQIEDALAAQRYSDARSMIAEVLRERPDSARAHLLNAFILVHVDHNRAAANAELQTAAGLDKRGDVKTSPLFGRVVGEIDAAPAKAAPALPRQVPPARESDWQTTLVMVLAFILLVAAFVLIVRAITAPRAAYYKFGGAGGAPVPTPLDPVSPLSPSWGGNVFMPQPAVAAQAPQQMGALGTAASVAGGVVAGNAISDLFRSRSSSSRNEGWDSSPSRSSSESSSSYSSSPTSYDSERSSFSSSSSGSSDWGSSSDSSSSYSSDSGSSSDW